MPDILTRYVGQPLTLTVLPPNVVTEGSLTVTTLAGAALLGPLAPDGVNQPQQRQWTLAGLPAGNYALAGTLTVNGTTKPFALTLVYKLLPAADLSDLSFTLMGPLLGLDANAPAVLQSASTEFLHVGVAALGALSGLPIDPTALTVTVAFTYGSAPQDADWQSAAWLTRADGSRFLRHLVTAGDILPGHFAVFVRFANGTETVILRAPDVLTVR